MRVSFSAQSVDIPLEFEEASEAPAPEKSEKGSAPSSLVVPLKQEKESSTPNIGRNAPPRDKIILTPDPLPEVSIPLKDGDDVPSAETSDQPVQPINTRQEGIDLPLPGSIGKGTESSAFTNIHDVRQFDLGGFYLGISPKNVLQMARQKGYFTTKTKRAIPLFQTTYYDTICRRSGIRAPEMIRACIQQHARDNQQDYIEEIIVVKKATNESFHFYFTSPATGNEAYQIVYQSRGNSSLNFTHQNLSKKLSRKEAFFNAVFNAYGYPDDKNEFIWGDKEKKDAYMQVSMKGSSYDATITLVDMSLYTEDYFAATDWKADQKPLYHFGFAE